MIAEFGLLFTSILGIGKIPDMGNMPSNASHAEVVHSMNRRVRRSAQNDQLKGKIIAYGIHVGESWEPATDGLTRVLHHYGEDGKEQSQLKDDGADQTNYSIEVMGALLKSIYSDDVYAYAYRVTICPRQVRHWGFMGIGSYGDNWFVRGVKSYVAFEDEYRLVDWSPRTETNRKSGSIGIGMENGVPSVAVAVNFENSDLSFVSRSSIPYKKYELEYQVNGYSNYSSHDVSFPGFFTFFGKGNARPSINITHDCFIDGKEWNRLRKTSVKSAL